MNGTERKSCLFYGRSNFSGKFGIMPRKLKWAIRIAKDIIGKDWPRSENPFSTQLKRNKKCFTSFKTVEKFSHVQASIQHLTFKLTNWASVSDILRFGFSFADWPRCMGNLNKWWLSKVLIVDFIIFLGSVKKSGRDPWLIQWNVYRLIFKLLWKRSKVYLTIIFFNLIIYHQTIVHILHTRKL